jgi:uncharacterized membrane protein
MPGVVANPREVARGSCFEATRPGILLGIGLGGFVDGILLHQILQWHHVLSSEGGYPRTTVGGLEDNTLADCLFHAGTWLAVVVDLWILAAIDQLALGGERRSFVARMLVGWGLSTRRGHREP